jgi:protein-tyrosine kinase
MNTIEKALQKKREEAARQSTDRQSDSSMHERIVETRDARERGSSDNSIEIDLDKLESAGMLTPDNGRSRIAEEMRAVKRPLLRNAFDKQGSRIERGNLIMVTSAMPGEGKSFNSINLAVSIAMELDKTVLLVDADVAKPSVAKYLGFRAECGLVDYLLDKSLQLSDILLKTNIPELSVLPAGKLHSHATEVLASDAMYALTQELSERYPDRVIIFDSPPLLATSESRVLATLMGQVLVVVESVKTTQAMLNEALSHLNSDQQVIGLLLNKVRGKGSGAYYSSYGYGSYGAHDSESD